MTALSRYARLESTGRWRAAPGEGGREVVVSFGHATLVLADGSGLPLAHWSLPAVTRLNPGTRPALYAPDEAGSETLEIDDEIMVSAIETVRRSVARARGGPHRLRRALWPTLAVLAAFLGLVWFPGAVRREALEVVPLSKRTEIGATLLGHLQSRLGPACRDPLGAEALQQLHDRALGQGGHAVVLPLGPAAPLVLPGHIAVVPRDLVERAAEPAVVAGHLLAAEATLDGDDPLGLLLDEVGVWATLRLLVTGNLDPAVLEAHAATLLAATPTEPDADLLGPAFAQAEVPLAPWALDLDPTGDTVEDLVAADAYAQAEAPILISDSEWVALQGICQGV
ncbi:hypothetical protein [Rubellimicrobium roseum]|uniref:Uncharacterized protein n=1 Tax=Rubellimicrobium roseum TaxID=687525 RepID=A0A5C4NGB0_9RHOB|nr:hypothetical protein [Rubellimicrobium roseum]TNC71499.1 hypothetical protein FHG71_11180 [Rubellimicrobium roseum]